MVGMELCFHQAITNSMHHYWYVRQVKKSVFDTCDYENASQSAVFFLIETRSKIHTIFHSPSKEIGVFFLLKQTVLLVNCSLQTEIFLDS